MTAFALAVADSPAQAITTTFGYTGGEQTFVVPPGVTSIEALLVGGRGSDGGGEGGGDGGAAAGVTTPLIVTPGQTLFIEVGGQGKGGGSSAFNGGGVGATGGGGGGGATDIRTMPRAAEIEPEDPRIVIAAGGGGAGAGDEGTKGGDGGGAGEKGGPLGGADTGKAGTSAAPGLGGDGCFGDGSDGELGRGGNGGAGGASVNGGGGGGGGYYGGGGGGGACSGGASGGGGGGGSSLVPAGGSLSIAPSLQPQVQLTYTLPLAVVDPAKIVPNTRLGKHPPKSLKTKAKRGKVKFGFTSTISGATFLCKLDKASFAACTSPKTYRVKPGKHSFSVKARTSDGADPTAATFAFRVTRVD